MRKNAAQSIVRQANCLCLRLLLCALRLREESVWRQTALRLEQTLAEDGFLDVLFVVEHETSYYGTEQRC